MLREHHDMHGQTIDIRAVLPGAAQPVVISHWMHPGVQRLSLEAFLVELNVGQRRRVGDAPNNPGSDGEVGGYWHNLDTVVGKSTYGGDAERQTRRCQQTAIPRCFVRAHERAPGSLEVVCC